MEIVNSPETGDGPGPALASAEPFTDGDHLRQATAQAYTNESHSYLHLIALG